MLCALYEGERLIGPRVEAERARTLSDAGALRCPCCDERVIFRAGERVIAHFAHRPGADCALLDDPDCRPESELHLSMKLALHDWVLALHPGAEAILEAPISTGQRADLLAVIEGQAVAFEVQCSPLSGAAWRARHQGYAAAGIRDVWILAGHEPRFDMIPGSERRGLPPSFRFHLRDLAATIAHETGLLLLAWQRVPWRDRGRSPLFHLLQRQVERRSAGPLLAAIDALAAHHGRRGAGPWADRPRRDRLITSGSWVQVAHLDACTFDPTLGLLVGADHRALRAAALQHEAAA